MRSPLRTPSVALFAALLFALTSAASAEKIDGPSWVPPQYAKFFYRRTDTRPAWERALNYLNVSVGETGRSFALVAGISKYPNMSGKTGDLWPARLDVEKMAAYLAGEPESFNEIVVLLDEDMTAENLRYFLTQYFPRRLAESPRSRFLFAYSGHGMTASNGRGYILTSEAASLQDWYNGISFATLRAQFQDIVDHGHQVLALINACYGVDFHRLSLAFGGESDAPLPRREGAHAITAGGSGEVTWHDPTFGEGDGPKGSIFFEGVFAALDGRADKLPADGIVSVGELETYLRSTVSRFTEQRQNPTGGDLIATTSPGGFFFLDRNRQIEQKNAEPLKGEWWGGVAFGGEAEERVSGESDRVTQASEQAGEAAAPPATSAALGEIVDERELLLVPSPITPPPTAPLVQMVGRWSGTAEEPGGFRFPVEVEIFPDCYRDIGACGEIAVPHVPCRGRISLLNILEEGFEFDVHDFDAASDKDTCQPGAGEVLKPLPDGTLSYTATYSGARGVLTRVR